MTALQTIVGLSVQHTIEVITKTKTGDAAGEWATCQRVSMMSGLTKPTVRKYLEILVAAGCVKKVDYGRRSTIIYKWIGE